MEEQKKDFGFIKNILNNNSLLRWVKKFSADGLQEESKADSFDVETDENTISISDVGMVKMFFSSSRFRGKTYISLDIKHIKEVLALVEGEGRLIINESDDKRLCYIQSGNNVVVIAPTSEANSQEKKPKKNKAESKDSKDSKDSEE
ncbi:hypothetical protein LCGC14_1470220 [marine sediment metagenome]|uniref:Uncharacterized protein n=1 Tax=marine sediment metagenome TaxID=412755 RepID=A0A0F9JCJ7_9ZZZZ